MRVHLRHHALALAAALGLLAFAGGGCMTYRLRGPAPVPAPYNDVTADVDDDDAWAARHGKDAYAERPERRTRAMNEVAARPARH